ncbi:MAG TPA: hypothetical protein VD866_13290 [Urbifossiella sp.]|nr:hypothetical protein [Urbifossiella sp.]
MTHRLSRWLPRSLRATPSRPIRRTRLGVAELEDRTVPAAPVAGVLAPAPLLPSDLTVVASGTQNFSPAPAAFDGTRSLSVWSQDGDIYGMFLTTAGGLEGPPC